MESRASSGRIPRKISALDQRFHGAPEVRGSSEFSNAASAVDQQGLIPLQQPQRNLPKQQQLQCNHPSSYTMEGREEGRRAASSRGGHFVEAADHVHYLNEVDTRSEAFHQDFRRASVPASTSLRHPGVTATTTKHVDVPGEFLTKVAERRNEPNYPGPDSAGFHGGSDESHPMKDGIGVNLPRQKSSGLLRTLTGDQKSEGIEKLKEKIRQQRLAQEKSSGGGGGSATATSGSGTREYAGSLQPSASDLFQFRGNQYLNSFGTLSNDEEFHRSPYPATSTSSTAALGVAAKIAPPGGSSRRAGGVTSSGPTASGTGSSTHVHFAGHVTSHYVDRTRSVTSADTDGQQIKSRKTGSSAHRGPTYRGFSAVPSSSSVPPPLPPKSSKTDRKSSATAVGSHHQQQQDRAPVGVREPVVPAQKRHVGKTTQADLITPFSWRKGQEATRAELGPQEATKVELGSASAQNETETKKSQPHESQPPDDPKNQLTPPTRDTDPQPEALSPIPLVDVELKEETGNSKSKAPIGGGEETPISLRHVSIEARKVLRDLQLPAKIDAAAKREGALIGEPTTPSRATAVRKRLQTGSAPRRIIAPSASTQPVAADSPKSKTRNKNQNTDELREWMAKKKADKRRQEKEHQKEQKEKEERKRIKLQELDAKRREKPPAGPAPLASPSRRPPSPSVASRLASRLRPGADSMARGVNGADLAVRGVNSPQNPRDNDVRDSRDAAAKAKRHFHHPRTSIEGETYEMEDVMNLPRGGESVVVTAGGADHVAKLSQQQQQRQPPPQRKSELQHVARASSIPASKEVKKSAEAQHGDKDFDSGRKTIPSKGIVPPPRGSSLTNTETENRKSDADTLKDALTVKPGIACATSGSTQYYGKATISSTADSQARRRTERKRHLAENAQSLQQRLHNFSNSFAGGAGAGGSLTNSNNSINETQPPKTIPPAAPKLSAVMPPSSVVHLSELVGPLPAAAEAKEEESSESTLTEANNGIDKPPTNPAQLYDVLRPDPFPGFASHTAKISQSAHNPTSLPVSSNQARSQPASALNLVRTQPALASTITNVRRTNPKWSRVAEPNPHAILAIYTNHLAEASAADVTVNALEEDILDDQIGAVVAKYAPNALDHERQQYQELQSTSAIVSTAAPVHQPSSAAVIVSLPSAVSGRAHSAQKSESTSRPSSSRASASQPTISAPSSRASTPSLPRPTPSVTPTLSAERFSAPEDEEESLTASFSTTNDFRVGEASLAEHLSSTTDDLEFSPSNLERQMDNQLNFLETTDEGLRHVDALGRTRAVALAQQETVTMAQVLKAQRLEQQRQMELLQAKTAKEKEIAERALAEAKANYNRLESDRESDVFKLHRDAQTSALNAQAEAAKVTASAARELAAANSSQRQMEAKFTAMLAAARDASLTGVSQAQQIEATSNAAAAAAVASVRELMREQDQRRQTAMSGNGVACGIDSSAAVFKAPQPAISSTGPSRSSRPSKTGSTTSSAASSTHGDLQGQRSRQGSLIKSKSTSDVGAPKSTVSGRSNVDSSTEKPVSDYQDFQLPRSRQSDASNLSIPDHAPAASGSHRRDSLMETSLAASETTMGDLSIGSEVTFDMSYRTDFDDPSMTEQEKEDRSFRALLPSESHRRRHRSASSASVLSRRSSRDGSPASAVSEVLAPLVPESENRRASIGGAATQGSRTSLGGTSAAGRPFGLEDSFSKFTHDIVNKYMQDDRVRMEHEAALIRLRENALKEKTQAQLEWIELQKVNAQKKGKKGEVDELMPKLKKKQMALMKQKEQAEAELREQKEKLEMEHHQRKRFLVMHQQEISRMRSSTQMLKKRMEKIKGSSRRRSSLESLPHAVANEGGRSSFGLCPPVGASSLPASAEQTMLKSPSPKGRKNAKENDDPLSLSLASSIKKAFDSYKEKMGDDVDEDKELEARQARLEKKKRDLETLKRRLTWSQRLDEEEAIIRKEERELVDLLKEKGADLDAGLLAVTADESASEVSVGEIVKSTAESVKSDIPSISLQSPSPKQASPSSRKSKRSQDTPSPSSSPSFASSTKKTVERRTKKSYASDGSISEDVAVSAIAASSPSASAQSSPISSRLKKKLTFEEDETERREKEEEESKHSTVDEVVTSIDKSGASDASEAASFSNSIFSPLKGNKTLEGKGNDAPSIKDAYTESFEGEDDSRISLDRDASGQSAPPPSELPSKKSSAETPAVDVTLVATESFKPPSDLDVPAKEVVDETKKRIHRKRSVASEASDVESDVENRIAALHEKLDARRREYALLSAEKKKRKNDRLRRHEAKLKEQIAQMEEQFKALQQERESSTSADESAAGSPHHTPKPAFTAAASTPPLPPSISAMATTGKSTGVAAPDNVVEKEISNRPPPQIRSPKASISPSPIPLLEAEADGNTTDVDRLLSREAAKADDSDGELEVDVFESLSGKPLTDSRDALDVSSSQSLPLFDLKKTLSAGDDDDEDGVDAEQAEAVATPESKKTTVPVSKSVEGVSSETAENRDVDKSDISAEKNNILSEKERILSRVTESINIKSLSGDGSPRTQRVNADSPVLSRKSSLTDTYRLDHSEVLSDSEAEVDDEREVKGDVKAGERALFVDDSISSSSSSSRPLMVLNAERENEHGVESSVECGVKSDAKESLSKVATGSKKTESTPAKSIVGGVKSFGGFREAEESVLESPLQAAYRSGRDSIQNEGDGEPSPGSYLEDSNNSLGSLCADLEGKLQLAPELRPVCEDESTVSRRAKVHSNGSPAASRRGSSSHHLVSAEKDSSSVQNTSSLQNVSSVQNASVRNSSKKSHSQPSHGPKRNSTGNSARDENEVSQEESRPKAVETEEDVSELTREDDEDDDFEELTESETSGRPQRLILDENRRKDESSEADKENSMSGSNDRSGKPNKSGINVNNKKPLQQRSSPDANVVTKASPPHPPDDIIDDASTSIKKKLSPTKSQLDAVCAAMFEKLVSGVVDQMVDIRKTKREKLKLKREEFERAEKERQRRRQEEEEEEEENNEDQKLNVANERTESDVVLERIDGGEDSKILENRDSSTEDQKEGVSPGETRGRMDKNEYSFESDSASDDDDGPAVRSVVRSVVSIPSKPTVKNREEEKPTSSIFSPLLPTVSPRSSPIREGRSAQDGADSKNDSLGDLLPEKVIDPEATKKVVDNRSTKDNDVVEVKHTEDDVDEPKEDASAIDRFFADNLIADDGDQEWMDDDYAFPAAIIPQKPPPPYPGSPAPHIEKVLPEGPSSTPERLMTQLQSQREEEAKRHFSVVPTKKDEISSIVSEAVDILSAQRSGGDALCVPKDFDPRSSSPTSDPLDEKEETERDSNAAYANLIFSLAKENFIDLYRDEYESDPLPWEASRRLAIEVSRQKRPRNKEDLKSLVLKDVLDTTRPLSPRDPQHPSPPRTSSRRNPKSQLWVHPLKSDDVVNVLIARELKTEETSWTNVETEEVDVKMALADQFLEEMMADVGHWLAGFSQLSADKLLRRKE